jgi:sirohydrochlorin cobaltochelatase
MSHGLLLFAHGARDAAWARPFEQARDHITAQHGPDTPVVLAFLEFMSPTLLQAGEQLARQGCDQVTVVPLFLGAGGHVRKDLPALMDQIRLQHPGTTWRLAPAVGETDTVVRALADAAWQLAHPCEQPGAGGDAA